MHKTKAGKQHQRLRFRGRSSKPTAAIALTLSFLLAGAAVANWGGSGATTRGSNEQKSGGMTIQGFSAASPSKEYVYAGGRLVATEECSYSISSTSSFFSSAGGPGTVNVTTDCEWEVVNVPSWITLTSDPVNHGNGVVTFEVRENFTGSARQAIFTIAGLSFTVVQDGGFANCVFEILPIFANFSSSGGTGSISVNVDSHCGWQAVSNASWVTVTSGCCGIGNGTVNYSVAPNTTGSGRAATISIGNKTFNVKQKAS